MSTASAPVQEAFLRRFHGAHPGVTARALEGGRVAGGGSSYDAVARRVAAGGEGGAGGSRVIVDLGCGDGALLAKLPAAWWRIGVDLSRAELAAAAARRLPGVALLEARAQVLPLATAAVDAVVSHLAFTLMADPAAVADEGARVLRPGGRFVAVVGGGPRGEDAYAGLLDLAMPVVRAAGAADGAKVPRLGELAARSEAGLRRLFAAERGWAGVTVDDLAIDLSGSPDEVWARLVGVSYELAVLEEAALAGLRAAFVAACPRWRRAADGQVGCTMACSLVEAVRG